MVELEGMKEEIVEGNLLRLSFQLEWISVLG